MAIAWCHDLVDIGGHLLERLGTPAPNESAPPIASTGIVSVFDALARLFDSFCGNAR
jgi:hypothetical protein